MAKPTALCVLLPPNTKPLCSAGHSWGPSSPQGDAGTHPRQSRCSPKTPKSSTFPIHPSQPPSCGSRTAPATPHLCLFHATGKCQAKFNKGEPQIRAAAGLFCCLEALENSTRCWTGLHTNLALKQWLAAAQGCWVWCRLFYSRGGGLNSARAARKGGNQSYKAGSKTVQGADQSTWCRHRCMHRPTTNSTALLLSPPTPGRLQAPVSSLLCVTSQT